MNQHQQQVVEYLLEENRVLREQIGNRRMRFNDDQRRRLAIKAKRLGRRMLARIATIVTPETLLAWHRKLIAEKHDGTASRRPGRPRTVAEVEALLGNLGHVLEHNTIAKILKQHGIDPAPERSRKTTWKEFLSRHWEMIVASDFFTVEVWTPKGLTRCIVLFFMDLSTRRVQIG